MSSLVLAGTSPLLAMGAHQPKTTGIATNARTVGCDAEGENSLWQGDTTTFTLDLKQYASSEQDFQAKFKSIHFDTSASFFDPFTKDMFYNKNAVVAINVTDILASDHYLYSANDIENGGSGEDNRTHDIFWYYQDHAPKHWGTVFWINHKYTMDETDGLTYIDAKYDEHQMTITFMIVAIGGTFRSFWSVDSVGSNTTISVPTYSLIA